MKYLILGNGPAGVVAAEMLRKTDPTGDIVLAGAEPEPPYSRMALPYLLEENIGEPGTYLRKDNDHFDRLGIALKTGAATSVDSGAKTVTFADGSTVDYDKLLIATGSHPIIPPIPGVDLPQVQTCWTLADARAIAARAKPGSRVVQVGAGFIGCIIMESLKARGVELTVVELGDRMVPRMMTEAAGGMIKTWVESKGISVKTSARVDRIDPAGAAAPAEAPAAAAPAATETAGEGSFFQRVVKGIFGGGAAESPAPASSAAPAPAPAQEVVADGEVVVTLSTGDKIACDLVIMSAGVRPNTQFLDGSGVTVNAGIVVNERLETSVPDIYAAGDVAEAPDLFTGAGLVSAIQPNAADQARVAALNMAGKNVSLPGVFAINVLDTLGLISSSFGQWEGIPGGDTAEHSDPRRFRYVSLQFDGDILIGATSVGLTQHVGVLRGLIQNRTPLGKWKDILMHEPLRFTEAYVACSQKPLALSA